MLEVWAVQNWYGVVTKCYLTDWIIVHAIHTSFFRSRVDYFQSTVIKLRQHLKSLHVVCLRKLFKQYNGRQLEDISNCECISDKMMSVQLPIFVPSVGFVSRWSAFACVCDAEFYAMQKCAPCTHNFIEWIHQIIILSPEGTHNNSHCTKFFTRIIQVPLFK